MARQLIITIFPRNLAGDSSPMYSGAIRDPIPTPRPITSRPQIILTTFEAVSCINAPVTNRTLQRTTVNLRPQVSAINPAKIQAISAPSEVPLVIHSFSSTNNSLPSRSDPMVTSTEEM
ncbi:hypothetical protein OGAPHI_006717 [Ogataea philodendri]|uniref:Uncharacterized protein n=1 Tax=Ogataea philodendri TaxID=1378263 RepID=A0A9P8T0X3_9ASCO|nr:uncharacterized protein OGAPHI_006717 [Ogataea philodendri]KAH3661310.1 hypothetical protein OGAPHI_006717 [Ogataea philodendri]